MEKRLLFIVLVMFGLCGEAAAQNDSLGFKEQYEAFKKKAQGDYTSFRDRANREYAEFMVKAWKSYGIQEPIKMPKREKLEPVAYNKVKAQKLLIAKKKKLLEEQKLLDEQKKIQEEQQKKLQEQESRQQQAQQQLSVELQQLEAAKKQLDEERQKFIEQQKEQQILAEQREQRMVKQLQLLDEKQKQQEADQKKLDEDKARHQQEQQLLAEEKERKETEHNNLLAEMSLQQKEAQQRIEEEQKKLEESKKQLEADKQKLQEEQEKLQQLSEEKERHLAEQTKQMQEQQQQLAEQKKLLELGSAQNKKEANRKLSEEQKKLQVAKKQLEKEQKELEVQKKQQQKATEQQQKQLAEQQQRLDQSLRRQEEQKALLDAEKKKQEQQRELLAEEKQRQEKEHQLLMDEQNKKLQTEQQRLMAEKKQLESDRQQLLADRRKQETELQQSSDAKKRELDQQQKQLEENLKKQKSQQLQLEEERKKCEEQKKLLAEEKAKQQERQKEIKKQERELVEGKAIQAEIVVVKEDVKPQPQPIQPVKENKLAAAKNVFKFYGTPMEVRWGNAAHFKLGGTDKKSISDAYVELTGKNYDNLLHDCLALRMDNDLCDWAYYKMLQDVAEAACGKGTNEAVLLQGVLYQQSGYMMRFGLDDNRKLHILSRLDGTVYDRYHWIVEDNVGKRVFFLMDGSQPQRLEICDVPYPKEQPMSFSIPKLPKLDSNLSDERKLESRFVSVEAKSAVNKNMIDFFNEYPASFKDNDVTTRWPYYANAPVSREVQEKLYPQLRKCINGATKLMAANMLLNWIQMGFPYAIDEKVWGVDRAFFAEETLYYPLCDCEDRSILFSHLVRDLLDLDVIMVYYPNKPQHMYTGVCFDENVQGDYIMVNGRKFTIADPTCYNANVGHTMNQMVNSEAKVIPLKRTNKVGNL